MPIRPLIREATRGPRFGGKGLEEADDKAEVEAMLPQVVPDSFDIPPEWGPSVELAQRVCSQLNLVWVIKQIALASSPVWKPEDPSIRCYTTCF